MGFKRQLFGIAIAGAALLGVQAPAGAVAITDLIANNGTITDGDKLFSNFSCTATSVGNTGGGCGNLDVAALAGPTVGLRFAGGLTAAGAGSTLDALIGYTVTVLDPTQAIDQISLAFNGSITGATSLNDASVSVSETVFSNGNVVGQIVVSAPNDLQDPPFEAIFDIPLDGQYSTVDVLKDIIISTFADGVAGNISFVDQDFEQTTRVPEPVTVGLLGIGLLGMGAMVRRRRTS